MTNQVMVQLTRVSVIGLPAIVADSTPFDQHLIVWIKPYLCQTLIPLPIEQVVSI